MRRQDKQRGGFLLGTLIGVVAGVAGGLTLLRQGRASESLVEFRDEVIADDGGETEVVEFAAVQSSTQPGPAERLRAVIDTLQARWNEAISEGRRAAADRRRELQAQLSGETKRLPEFEAELLEAAREHSPDAVREFERLTGGMKEEG
jgi:hypothetical protein